ncbi:universal stress protein [Nocardioides alcanivorans]|uniref:universal stress protein n=1 Tax=Nocardioides alcanivorans TaxID=2897352 RepID=UPI001F2ED9AD|nr:universal stress protein [Nocardioides alcanivorans]
MPKLIIVGVDGNAPAEQAARIAADLARATSSGLHVVCAYGREEVAEIELDGPGTARVSIAEESADIAARTASTLGEGIEHVTSAAIQGRPAEVLVAEAERLEATLIVTGNKRAQGPGRLLGSIAAAVTHHAPCDVYIAHTN